MKERLKETWAFTRDFTLGSLKVAPVHVRIEELMPVINAHRHSNVSYEIHYTKSGSGTVEIDGKVYDIDPDTLYITGPGVTHAQYSEKSDPVIEYCLYLKCEQRTHSPSDPLSIFVETPFWFGKDAGRLFPLLESLIKENQNPQEDVWEMSETILRMILLRLSRLYREQSTASPKPLPGSYSNLASLIPKIEDAFFYSFRTLTLTELADQLSLSERQTQRLLKTLFGKSFSQKKTEACMAEAVHYLLQTDKSITDISEALGFSSMEHFSTAFKKQMGKTPSQYRKDEAKGGGCVI